MNSITHPSLRLLALVVSIVFAAFIIIPSIALGAPTDGESETEVKELLISVVPERINEEKGAAIRGDVTIQNTGKTSRNLVLYLATSESQNPDAAKSSIDGVLKDVRFYGEIPEEYAEEFADTKQIGVVCKKQDESEDLDLWCEGRMQLTLTLPAGEEVIVPYTLRVGGNANPNVKIENASVLVREVGGEGEVSESESLLNAATSLVYEKKIKKVVQVEITELKVMRSFNTLDFIGWAQNGFKEGYDAQITFKNTGTHDMEMTASLLVTPDNKEEQRQERVSTVSKDEEKTEVFDRIAMERIGQTKIVAQLLYTDDRGPQTIETDAAVVNMIPIKEIIAAAVGLFLTLSLVTTLWLRKKRSGKGTKKKGSTKKSDSSKEVLDDNLTVEDKDHKKSPSKAVGASKVSKAVNVDSEKESKHIKVKQGQVHSATNSDLDLEWMQDGDSAFAQESRAQERKMNIRVGLAAIALLLAFGALVAFVVKQVFFAPKEKVNTLEALVQEDEVVVAQDDAKTEGDEDENPNTNADDVDESTDQDVDESSQDTEDSEVDAENDIASESSTIKEPEKTAVTVLNGGGRSGAAGALTNTIKAKKYKALTPKNATNSYAKTTIYYGADQKAEAQGLIDALGAAYENVLLEESASIVARHSSDLVIVIGSSN